MFFYRLLLLLLAFIFVLLSCSLFPYFHFVFFSFLLLILLILLLSILPPSSSVLLFFSPSSLLTPPSFSFFLSLHPISTDVRCVCGRRSQECWLVCFNDIPIADVVMMCNCRVTAVPAPWLVSTMVAMQFSRLVWRAACQPFVHQHCVPGEHVMPVSWEAPPEGSQIRCWSSLMIFSWL